MVNYEEKAKQINESDAFIVIKIYIAIVIVLGSIFAIISYVMGEPLISLIISIFIAIISLLIAYEAFRNTKQMARADLLGIVRSFFNSRYTFFREIHRLENNKNISKSTFDWEAKRHMEFATWDSVLCLKQANILKKWVISEDKDKLANTLYILMDNVLEFKSKNLLKNRHVEHLLISCQELEKLGISNDWKTKIICLLQKNKVGTFKPKSENFKKFIKRGLENVINDPNGKIPKDKYLNFLFVGFE